MTDFSQHTGSFEHPDDTSSVVSDDVEDHHPGVQTQLAVGPVGLTAPQTVVAFADFSDGHTIRQMFEFFRVGLPCAPMIFTEQGIYIERANGFKTLLVRCAISRKNLVGYSFDRRRCNDPTRQRHIINFELPDFNTQVKSLAKKEGIRIYQSAENPDFVFGQLYGGNKSTSQGVIFFRSREFEPATYKVDPVGPETIPNQVISLLSFCSACTNAARSKYPYAQIIVYPNGLRIVAGNETGSTGRRDVWGDCSGYVRQTRKVVRKAENPTDPDIEELKEEVVQVEPFITCVPLADIRALMKTANLHQSGIVRVYSTRNQLTRLEIPAGSLCELTIILQGKDPQKILDGVSAAKRKKPAVASM
jgi:hypothetical protein